MSVIYIFVADTPDGNSLLMKVYVLYPVRFCALGGNPQDQDFS